MKIKYYFGVFAAFILLMQLSSCMEVERKITINANGSGNEKQIIKIDKVFYDMMVSMVQAFDSTKSSGIRDSLYNHEDNVKKIREDFASKNGIKLNNISGVTNSDSSSTYYLDYDFDKVEYIALSTNINPDGSDISDNKTEVKWTDKGDVIYFSLKTLKNSGDTDKDTKKDAGYFFAGKEMKISVDFPFDIKSTNATSKSGRTASWVFEMSKITEDPSILFLEATLKK